MIILYPFELLLSKVFLLSYSITGHYGYALIIMSVIITALTTPLYMLAERWKNHEKAIKLKMQLQVDSIKENFKGQKQYYLLQTTHRIYGYKSWYPLQTSMGIIFQIPFFFAAYNVLSHFTGYNNVSFGAIKNLSEPDGILFGINILPLIMTLLNILSSFYYTKSFKIKDNTQQFVLAGVFLLLLYDSPAALLLYWTCNNFLSLIKNIVMQKKNNTDILHKTEIDKNSKLSLIHACALIYILAATAVNYNAQRYNKFILLASLLFLGICFIYSFFIKKNKFNYKIIPYGIIYTGFLYLYITKSYFLSRTLLVFLMHIFNVRFFYLFFTDFKQVAAQNPILKIGKLPYYTIIGECVFLFAFLLPIQLYVNNPTEFQVQPFAVLLYLIPIFLGILAVFILSAYLLKSSPLFFKALIFSFICFWFYTLLLPLNAGTLSEFTFQADRVITQPAASLYIKDFIILLFSFYIVYFLIQKKQNMIFPLITILSAAVLLNICIKWVHFTAPVIQTAEIKSDLPETTHLSHRLSKNGRNVIFFMPDMMNGNYVQRTFDEFPELKEKFSGFTWYKDTLSISASTVHSLPAMMGGVQYTPLSMNKTDNSYHTDQQKSLEILFTNFLEHGFHCTNVGYSSMFQKNENISKLASKTNLSYFLESPLSYIGYWNKEKNIKVDYSAKLFLLTMLPFYNAAPYIVKTLIYDEGTWNNLSLKLKNTKAFTLRSYPYLDLLPEICSITETKEDKFMFIANELTHNSFGINKDGNFLSTKADLDDPDLPYYSARTFLIKISQWLEWLKANNLYDNTLIVIASDHGNFARDNGLLDMPFKFGRVDYKTELSRVYPTLLFKDFNADLQFTTSDIQTQNSDVPLIFAEHVFTQDTSFSDLKKYTAVNPRERTYSLALYTANDFPEKIKIPFSTYRVKGSIFNADNWDHLDEQY